MAFAVFLLFALGVYGGINIIFRVVYNSRLIILETSILSENLEIAHNLPFEDVGIIDGNPSGSLPYQQTITRNGIDFTLTATVRNIDDPFDGTATTTPADESPADYKLVEMSIICQNCAQKSPVVLSSVVSPLGLEGESNNGSLFIHVFDAEGHDVVGANVSVVNTEAEPDITINDTTDNEGMLYIVDTVTGTTAYNITVGKDRYSQDYTVEADAQNPNPTKLPSTVISRTVTEISFSIDRLGSLDLNTISPSCSALGDKTFRIWGDKTIGSNPVIYKYDQNLTTDGSGSYLLSSAEWDEYTFSASGTAYDLVGTIPMMPIDLSPEQNQEVFLILTPHTDNSLLVNVRDSGASLPLSDASVRLYKIGYDSTVLTGMGYTRQTDWSGGSGQNFYTDETSYFSDSGSVENNSPAGDLELSWVGGYYLSSGWLESSTIDLGAEVDYRNIIWEPLNQPANTSLKFQIAASNSSTPSAWEFTGPDNSSSTFYTATNTLIYSGHDNNRYLRYKVFLETWDNSETPRLSEVSFTYTNQCNPPGQSFFSGLSEGLYTLEVSRDGYESSSDPIDIDGNLQTTVDLSASI